MWWCPANPADIPNWFACGCVMDLGDKPYRSRMRIAYPEGIREVEGQWFVCPEGAQVIPFLHPYLALEWHKGELNNVQLLGEVPFSRRYAILGPNDRYTGQCFIGDEDQWNGNTDPWITPAVDAQGIPIPCCALPIPPVPGMASTFGQERIWFGRSHEWVHERGHWNREHAWYAGITTTAHYLSHWARLHSWRGIYETTDHFAARYADQSKWGAVVKTTAHYVSTWGRQQSVSHTDSSPAHYVSTWARQQSLRTVYETTDHFAASFDQEQSWAVVVRTAARQTAAYDQESRWTAAVKTTSKATAAWKQEQAWAVVVKTAAYVAASWNRQHRWSAVIATVDNVQTFTCGTAIAAGSTQGTATPLAFDTNSVTSTGANQGAILAAGCYRMVVQNSNAGGGNAINVYPPTGAKIGNGVVNTPQSLAAGSSVLFIEISATQWRMANLT